MRDNVKGPNKDGVAMLRKLVQSAPDKEQVHIALASLELMLMGQEPTVAGKAFLRKRAAKFVTKAPEATEALNTLEHIFVLQQLGKDAAEMGTTCPTSTLCEVLFCTACGQCAPELWC